MRLHDHKVSHAMQRMEITDHILRGPGTEFVKTPNHGGEMAPDTIVFHATLTPDAESAIKSFLNPETKISAHLVIGTDGDIIQMVPFNIVAWHAGRSEYRGRKGLNNYAVGIELVNEGALEKSGESFISRSGREFPEKEVLKAPHRNASAYPDNPETQEQFWQLYTEQQIDTAGEICRLLIDAYSIHTIVGHEEISPDRKTDPGPAFPLDGFRKELLPAIDFSAKESAEAAGKTKRKPKTGKKTAAKPESPPSPDPENVYARHLIEKMLHNDSWAETDLLGYELYSSAIKEMIVTPDRKTRPPLTIAVLAPWGQGKTTLMRYIERSLIKVRAEKLNEPGTAEISAAGGGRKKSSGGNTRNRLKLKDLLDLRNIEPQVKKIPFPSVWFNPWKYQSSEQIWAGMAHAVIGQLAAYLPPADREKFWFRLNLRRIDISRIRSTIHRRIFSFFVSDLSIVVILLSLLLLLLPAIGGYWLLQNSPELDSAPVKIISGLLSAIGLATPPAGKYIQSKRKILNENLKDEFNQVVREPDYEKHLGFFHEVERDVREVFDLIVDESAPAVIFIDDLDRCSPDKVVEVIEAMNLMINSSFSSKCYFIIGMDSQMVAASLDEKYQSLVDKFREEEAKYGSIGWYFLDKFIQLPIFLPILSPQKKRDLLNRMFTHQKTEYGGEIVKEEDRDAVDAYVRNKTDTKMKERVRTLFREKPDLKQRFVELNIKEIKEDSPEIIGQLTTFSPYLGTSPRSIKRFVNMFRFYYSYQELRSLEGEAFANPDSLAKWLVLSLRYPQLVRFIQWEREDKIIHSKVPEEKASRLDEIFREFRKNKKISEIGRAHV